jgi:hypothetical protein
MSVTDAERRAGEALTSRNADGERQAALEWHCQFAEHRRRRVSLARAASRDGRSCGGCGRVMEDGETVWMLSNWDHQQAPFGRECVPSGLLARAEGRVGHQPRPIERCEGCGRPAVYLRLNWQRRWPACSRRCRWIGRNRRRAELLAEARLRDCAICGERFQPARSDTTTCSSACRQRAYRRRRMS